MEHQRPDLVCWACFVPAKNEPLSSIASTFIGCCRTKGTILVYVRVEV
mgnify:CR=1 FL=1